MEGIFFYAGSAMILSFNRQNRMKGIGEQFQYILRDETVHLNFGIDLINGIKAENPELWTAEFQEQLVAKIRQAVTLEIAYAEDRLPNGVLGLNADLFREYVQFIADRRLERTGLPRQYRAQPVPLDERDDRPRLGEEFLRKPGDGGSERGESDLELANIIHGKTKATCEVSKVEPLGSLHLFTVPNEPDCPEWHRGAWC